MNREFVDGYDRVDRIERGHVNHYHNCFNNYRGGCRENRRCCRQGGRWFFENNLRYDRNLRFPNDWGNEWAGDAFYYNGYENGYGAFY